MTCRQGVVAALVALLAAPAAAGEVKGTVHFSGAPPKLAPLVTNRDQKVCGKEVPDESVEVKDGALGNVVVTVSGAGAAKPAPKTIQIDQKDCRYHPHVQTAPAGSTVEILNDDPMLHNIHGYLGQQTVFNLAMPLKGQKIPKPLSRAGVVHVKCDVHNWMNGWVIVTDSPAAVAAANGTYAIPDLPAGTYTVTAWHEKLGQKTQQISVPATGAATADFTFGASGGTGSGSGSGSAP